MNPPDEERRLEIEEALKTIFIAVKSRGDNFMAGTLFVDGYLYKVTVKIEAIIE